MVVVKDSTRLNGLSSLAITKLDVLTGLDLLKICVGYDVNGERLDYRPAGMKQLAQCKPVYEKLPGWEEDITQAEKLDQLPQNAQTYLKRIEEISGVPISIVSVGPSRDETIVVKDPFQCGS